ncbi:MAG: tRNA epoxyqueuosine(34) reductase QueG [Paludibacteraceae bacterium]
MSLREELTQYIKQQALLIGFDACGIAKAEFLEEDSQFFNAWIQRKYHAQMGYLERNSEKRFDPHQMVEGCKSVVVALINYYPLQLQEINSPRIAKYAYSKIDYHTVIKEKLQKLEKSITDKFGDSCFNKNRQHRFVDSAPVLERRWGEKAGLGWIGKNKMLIHPDFGSFFFLGELFLNVELEYDKPIKNRCGICRKCLDACPTNALSETRGLDSLRCISYQTIENKKEVDVEIRSKLSGFAFGCDICNDVCPWNISRKKPTKSVELQAADEIKEWNLSRWENLDPKEFDDTFKHSALKRAGFEKLKQNIHFVTKEQK